MAYIELEDLRGELDIDGTGDNPLLQQAIQAAQVYIESQTNRRFEAATATRYYARAAVDHGDSYLLHLDGELYSVTTLTNGDTAGTAIAAADYWLEPRNYGPPYHAIRLKTGEGVYWEFDEDCWVSVAGAWGYSTSAPYDIRRACTILAAYFYRQKDAQQFETTAIVESGAIAIPQGIPATVDRILARYKRYL